jgi:NADH dehydrogenase [ubiquinone] 1 alpha subcomplex assembly factor 1
MRRTWSLFACIALIGATLVASPHVARAADKPEVVLFGFGPSASEPSFRVVNDGVMGGVSQSTVRVKAGVLTFVGKVNLENNGGFASMRTTSRPDPTGATVGRERLALRVKSSGSTFSMTIETKAGWYWSTFTTKAGSWLIIELPFESFVPHTRFGEVIDGQPYDGAPMIRLGVIITNKKAESFRLDLDSIAVR